MQSILQAQKKTIGIGLLKFALTWLRGFKFLRLMTLPSSAKPEETVERMRQEVEGGGKKVDP